MGNKYDKLPDTPFTQKELDQTRDNLFNVLIPKIQRHVDETGHILTEASSCHDCIDFRHSYTTAINILNIASRRDDLSAIEIIDLTEQEEAYLDTESRKLSD